VKVDVRVVTATNKDLEKEVATATFRSDLFYRLNVFPIFLPPLRDRGPDILLLADFFVLKYAQEFGKFIAGSRIELVDGAGHLPHLENLPSVGDKVGDFLADQDDSTLKRSIQR
jgi:pimeloyl-ACP methyl ester carboxylesterase